MNWKTFLALIAAGILLSMAATHISQPSDWSVALAIVLLLIAIGLIYYFLIKPLTTKKNVKRKNNARKQ